MLQEKDIIPYTPSDIPPGPYLVFAPHPDDETFGMGGTIALAAHAGIAVHVVVLTDGQ
ncbi:MAG: PIG-L family deacetylase, partial [Deltaproteobacteria bacterium]|nr:PIG-L family deacetylase [Deltaproteobacteria bacterium]